MINLDKVTIRSHFYVSRAGATREKYLSLDIFQNGGASPLDRNIADAAESYQKGNKSLTFAPPQVPRAPDREQLSAGGDQAPDPPALAGADRLLAVMRTSLTIPETADHKTSMVPSYADP